MEALILLGIGIAMFCSGQSPNTKSINGSTNDKITINSKQDKEKQLYFKFSNLSEYEINIYLKENNLFTYYKDYSKEFKINKIIERKMYFNN